MQIFLPYVDNVLKSCNCLDNRRLHKEIVECKQIIKAIFKEKNDKGIVPWENHPCVKMYACNTDFIQCYLTIFEIYWSEYKRFQEQKKIGFDRMIEQILNVKTAKNEKDLSEWGYSQSVNELECIWVNKADDLLYYNRKAKELLPDFLKNNTEFEYTQRGRLYVKDPVYYADFEIYKNYGDKNLYYDPINKVWNAYYQKVPDEIKIDISIIPSEKG